MSMIINTPTAQVTTYDVANQTDVQFNFDFDPTAMRADGTTLVVEYDGSEIRLENFFDADGGTHVENFLTQDGQAFSASEFLAAIMDVEGTGDTAEGLETAAGAAAGGSGAGAYSDDAGSLFDGLNALGGQGDAYDQPEIDQLDPVAGLTPDDGGSTYIVSGDERWGEYDPQDYYNPDTGLYDLPDDIMAQLNATGFADFTVSVEYKGSGDVGGVDGDQAIYDNMSVELYGRYRNFEDFEGTAGSDTLIMDDDGVTTPFGTTYHGFALRLEDDFSFDDAGPHVQNIEFIEGSEGGDLIDLSSADYTYGPVTIHGNGGDDVIWTNDGDDTLYGGEGDDFIIGGTGDDQVYGETGDDRLFGGWGDDMLDGGSGDDHMVGGTGADTLIGGAGDDYISGGDGADFINGGSGNDEIFGGMGNDTINAGTGQLEEVTLGDGNDTVLIDASSLTPDLDSGDWSSVHIQDFVDGVDQVDLGGNFFQGLVTDPGGSTDVALEITQNADGSGNSTILVLDNWSTTDFYSSQLHVDLTT